MRYRVADIVLVILKFTKNRSAAVTFNLEVYCQYRNAKKSCDMNEEVEIKVMRNIYVG